MVRRNKVVQKIVEESAEIHRQNLPLVEIMGDQRVLIEYHRGVLAYGCEEIILRVRSGRIRVTGQNLRLAKMTAQQLVICGKISGVQLEKEGR